MSNSFARFVGLIQFHTGLTLEQLAAESDVDPKTLRRWRRSGNATPSWAELQAWQKLMRVSFDALMQMMNGRRSDVPEDVDLSSLGSFREEWTRTLGHFKAGNTDEGLPSCARTFEAATDDDQRAETYILQAALLDLVYDYPRVVSTLEEAMNLRGLSPRYRRRLGVNLASPYLYVGKLWTAIKIATPCIDELKGMKLPRLNEQLPWESEARPYDRTSLAIAQYFRGFASLDLELGASPETELAHVDLTESAEAHDSIAQDADAPWARDYAKSCRVRAKLAAATVGLREAEEVAQELDDSLPTPEVLSQATPGELEQMLWTADSGARVSRLLKGRLAEQMQARFHIQFWQIAKKSQNVEFYRRFFLLEHARRRRANGRIEQEAIERSQFRALVQVMSCIPEFVPRGLDLLFNSLVELGSNRDAA